MIQKTVAVTANQHISGVNYKMRLTVPEIVADSQPGQFVMIRPDDGLKPFLPRPFSIHRINTEAGELELLYKVVGDGTRHMTGLAAGDRLSVIGPLGKGFRFDRPLENIALVGGGIGVAPLVFLADAMAAGSYAPDRISVFIGGATNGDVLCRDCRRPQPDKCRAGSVGRSAQACRRQLGSRKCTRNQRPHFASHLHQSRKELIRPAHAGRREHYCCIRIMRQ